MPDTASVPMARLDASAPLFTGPNWDYAALRQVYDAIERIALDELGLDIYPVQVEVITSEQMLDAYASVGLPLMYRHWSFGKRFAYHETLYRKGLQGLAYEIVINSNPLHLLHHGRELHDDADARHGACRALAITISSRTTICFGSGPMPTASRII